MAFPVVWLVLISLRPGAELVSGRMNLLPDVWTLDNYRSVVTSTPLLRYFINSAIIATVSTTFTILTSVVAGYIFAKFRFMLRSVLFGMIVATAIVPFEVYMLPLFGQVRSVGLFDSLGGVIFPYVIMTFGIFFMRQNVIANVPDDLLGAARIDGMTEAGIMLRLVPRLVAPAISALAILAFSRAWIAFIWPLMILNTRDRFPLELGLVQFSSGYLVHNGERAAAALLAIVPTVIIFVILRRRIVEGIAMTGMSG